MARREGSIGPTSESFGQHTDNAAKYARASAVERFMLSHFKNQLLAQLRPLAPGRILDAGCGEGHVTSWLADALPEAEVTGVDGRQEALAAFRARNPGAPAVEADLRALPFDSKAFDLALCVEVLEHVPEPHTVLRELSRVSAAQVFVTVPHEPFFRIGNLAAGKYVSRLGSTPGHIWTWSRRAFLQTVAAEAEPLRWVSLFPWQAVLARPRDNRDSQLG